MRKIVLLILICILLNFSAFSDINVYLQGEIQTAPWFYEPVYEMNCVSFSTAWMIGLKMNRFILGLDAFSSYVSLNGNKESYLFKGAWFDLGCNLFALYEVMPWLALKLGAGFFWNQSSFDFNNSGWLGRSLPGLEVLFSSMFSLTPYLHLEVINRLDLLLSQNGFMEDVYYQGGIRIHIDPGFLRPLSFYLEFDASYWNYTNTIMADGVKSWMFQGQVGIILHFNKKPSKMDNNGDKIKDIDIDIDVQDDKTVPVDEGSDQNDITVPLEDSKIQNDIIDKQESNKEKHYNNPNLEKLKNSEPGESIQFYDILFKDEDITDESLPVLNGIAEILIENDTLVISIRGYSEFIQNPQRELELCQIRAKKIKDYLVARGVKDTQVQQNSIGNIIMGNNEKYIMIDVIKNTKGNSF